MCYLQNLTHKLWEWFNRMQMLKQKLTTKVWCKVEGTIF